MIAIVGGLSAAASVVVANAQIGFLLAIAMVIVFQTWAGMELYRGGLVAEIPDAV